MGGVSFALYIMVATVVVTAVLDFIIGTRSSHASLISPRPQLRRFVPAWLFLHKPSPSALVLSGCFCKSPAHDFCTLELCLPASCHRFTPCVWLLCAVLPAFWCCFLLWLLDWLQSPLHHAWLPSSTPPPRPDSASLSFHCSGVTLLSWRHHHHRHWILPPALLSTHGFTYLRLLLRLLISVLHRRRVFHFICAFSAI